MHTLVLQPPPQDKQWHTSRSSSCFSHLSGCPGGHCRAVLSPGPPSFSDGTVLLYVDGPGPLDEPVARFLPLAITGAVLMNCLVYASFQSFANVSWD